MTVVYFFSVFQRIAVPGTLFNEIHSDPLLNANGPIAAAAVTALGSIYLGIYGIIQIFVGWLADRFGGARLIRWSGVLLAAGTLIFPFAATLDTLYAARVLVGTGASGMYLSVVKEIALRYPARRFSAILGTCTFVGHAGGLAATYPLERAVRVAGGWREALFCVGILTAVAVALSFWTLRRSRAPAVVLPLSFAGFRSVLNRRTFSVLAVSAINFSVYFAVLSTNGKKCLQDVAGLDSGSAALVVSLMSAVSLVAILAGGRLSAWAGDRRKPFVWLGSGLTLAAAAAVILGIRGDANPWLITGGYIAFAAAQVASVPLVAVLKELVPAGREGFAIGILNSLCYTATAVAATAAGLFLDRHHAAATTAENAILYPPAAYIEFFLLIAVLAAASLALVFTIPETRGQPQPSAVS